MTTMREVDEQMDQLVFKVLAFDGRSPFQYKHWSLPTEKGPGRWMPPLKLEWNPLRLCRRGYHLCRWQDIYRWLYPPDGQRLFLAEYRGEVLEPKHEQKLAVQQARLLQPLSNPFASYAEHDSFRNWKPGYKRTFMRKWLISEGVLPKPTRTKRKVVSDATDSSPTTAD